MPESKLVFRADTASATRGIKNLEKSVEGLGSSFNTLGTLIKGAVGLLAIDVIASGVQKLGGFLIDGVKGALDFSDATMTMSESLGIAAKDLVLIQEEFRQANLDADSVGKVLNTLNKNVQAPSDKIIGWLDQFGISIKDLQSQGLGEQFNTIANAIGSIEDPAVRLKMATDFFGKAGVGIAALAQNFERLEDAKNTAGELADAVGSDELNGIGDNFEALAVKVKTFWYVLTNQLAPTLKKIGDYIAKIKVGDFAKSIGDGIQGFITAVENVGFWEAFKAQAMVIIKEIAAYLTAALTIAFQEAVKEARKSNPIADAMDKSAQWTHKTNLQSWNLANNKGPIQNAMDYASSQGVKLSDADLANAKQQYYASGNNPNVLFDRVAEAIRTNSLSLNKTFDNVLKEKQAQFGVEDAKKALDTLKEGIPDLFTLTGENGYRGTMGDTRIITTPEKPEKEEKKAKYESNFEAMSIPRVSSLARVGGAGGDAGSLIKVQQKQLNVLERIEKNQSSMGGGLVPVWGRN